MKVLTVAPDNPSQGLPRIQGVYLLHDAATLTLQAVLDGTALTTARTPAVSVAGTLPMLERRVTGPVRMVVLGAGPQATAHADDFAACLPAGLASVHFLVRDAARRREGLSERARLWWPPVPTNRTPESCPGRCWRAPPWWSRTWRRPCGSPVTW